MPQCLFTDCLSRHCILSPVASCFWKLYGLGRSHWTQCGFRKFLLLTIDPASIGSWEENRKGCWEKLRNAVNSKEGAREDDFKISFPSYSPSLHSQVPVSRILPHKLPAHQLMGSESAMSNQIFQTQACWVIAPWKASKAWPSPLGHCFKSSLG